MNKAAEPARIFALQAERTTRICSPSAFWNLRML